MVWGKGGMFNRALGGKIPVLDFAGAPFVHVSSGVAALVAATVLGKRMGHPREPMLPHNVVLSLIGTGLLWVGWFGFNAGSAVSADAYQRLCRHPLLGGGRRAELGRTGMAAQKKGKPACSAASGMVAGLATITPASGFVTILPRFSSDSAAGRSAILP